MNLLFSILLSDIIPIFAIAGVGFLLARYASADVKTVSRVVFYGLLPCFAFQMILSATATGPTVGRLIALAVVVMVAMAVVGYFAARGLGLDGKHLRAFMMVVMFSNAGNYGLPVVRFAFGPTALTYATIFFLTGSVTTYVASAFFAGSRHGRILGVLDKLWRMPALYGLAAALIVLAFGWKVPDAVMRPVTMLSDAALPVMILVLGMQLRERARLARAPGGCRSGGRAFSSGDTSDRAGPCRAYRNLRTGPSGGGDSLFDAGRCDHDDSRARIRTRARVCYQRSLHFDRRQPAHADTPDRISDLNRIRWRGCSPGG